MKGYLLSGIYLPTAFELERDLSRLWVINLAPLKLERDLSRLSISGINYPKSYRHNMNR